jgi:amidase
MYQTARELAAAIRAKQISASEALEASLARVDAVNPELNAVIWRNDDQARKVAAAVDTLIACSSVDELPPFCGVPIPIKDVTPVAGWPVTYCSRGAPSGASGESELVVDRFEDAGFILTGRTNASEFASLPAEDNRRYGITRNPWMASRTPGGSSSGAAAAVAAGMFAVAHASDSGGSIRIPASCCGLVGMKASRGRVPSRILAWEGGAVEGVITRDVADAAAVLDVICGPDRGQWYNAPSPVRPFSEAAAAGTGHLRVGVVSSAPFGLQIDTECRQAVHNTALTLEGMGHEIVPTELKLPDEILAAALAVVNTGTGEFEDINWEKTEPHTQASRHNAQSVNSLEYVAAVYTLQRFTREFIKPWTHDFDVLLTPTMTVIPPLAGSLLFAADTAPGALPLEVIQTNIFTAVFNTTGQPAISLPMHMTADGLPVGVQLVGGPWDESTLISISAELEEASGWRNRVPSHSGQMGIKGGACSAALTATRELR